MTVARLENASVTYMQARYYDPVIGRFLSNDPVGFAEGGTQTVGFLAGIAVGLALSESGPGVAVAGAATDVVVTDITRSVLDGNLNQSVQNSPPVRGAVIVYSESRRSIYNRYCPRC